MKAFVAVTDNDWFEFLGSQPELDEVNFWTPSGRPLASRRTRPFGPTGTTYTSGSVDFRRPRIVKNLCGKSGACFGAFF